MATDWDYRISLWTAEFADPGTEAAFRADIQEVWAKATHLALMVAALVFFVFTVTDYLNMGAGAEYSVVFSTRLAVSLFGLAAAFYAKRFAAQLVSGLIPTAVVFTALCAFVLIIPYRPFSPGWHGMSMMAMLLGIYVFVPNRFVLSVSMALLGTVGFLWQVLSHFYMAANYVLTLLLLMSVINLLGGITVYRVNRMLREQFCTASTLRDANERLSGEIAARQRLEAELRGMALRDDLTGAANRRQFFDQAERELASARRQGQAVSLLLLDIDHFRQINDRYGHVRSDEVLRALTEACRGWLQGTEWLARVGGEEFAVLLTDVGQTNALERAERLRQTLEHTPVNLVDATLYFTVSVGVAEAQAGESLGMLMRRADSALHAAKLAGRNRVMSASITTPA
ncbi:MAG: GGDEF domain-containing protein [Hydrogenophilaceae bacterium]|nr:GGDEF domain-containing protein [Hydrogenophilaceae bacterium]